MRRGGFDIFYGGFWGVTIVRRCCSYCFMLLREIFGAVLVLAEAVWSGHCTGGSVLLVTVAWVALGGCGQCAAQRS